MRDLLFVIDPAGQTFSALRDAMLGIGLWRADEAASPEPDGVRLALVAVPAVSWEDVVTISARLPTVVIAATPSEHDALRALEGGAIGYLDIATPADSMRRAIAAALLGELVYSRRILATAIRAKTGARVRSWVALTPRQRQVLTLISQGATDKQIAVALGIAPATAQKHASNLVRRLGVPNRAAAVANAAATA